jgi:uncharacterized RDD family membrane protein YckC
MTDPHATPPMGWGGPPPPPGAYYGGQIPAQPYQPGGWSGMHRTGPADPGLRVAAKLIDIVIHLMIQTVISVVGGLVLGAVLLSSSDTAGFGTSPFGGFSAANFALSAMLGLLIIGVDFVYNVVLVSKFGGQPGKLMLGLRVVSADGSPPTMSVALRRWSPILALLVLAIVPVVSIFAGIGRFVLLVANLVMVFADDQHRSVFDHVGGTLVVRTG